MATCAAALVCNVKSVRLAYKNIFSLTARHGETRRTRVIVRKNTLTVPGLHSAKTLIR